MVPLKGANWLLVLRDFSQFSDPFLSTDGQLNVLRDVTRRARRTSSKALCAPYGRSFRTRGWRSAVVGGGSGDAGPVTWSIPRAAARSADGPSCRKRHVQSAGISVRGPVIVFGWQDLAILNGPPVARRASSMASPRGCTQATSRRCALPPDPGRAHRLLQGPGAESRLAPWDEQAGRHGHGADRSSAPAVAALSTSWPGVSGAGRCWPQDRGRVSHESRRGDRARCAPAALERRRGPRRSAGVSRSWAHTVTTSPSSWTALIRARSASRASSAAGAGSAAGRGAARDGGGRHRPRCCSSTIFRS